MYGFSIMHKEMENLHSICQTFEGNYNEINLNNYSRVAKGKIIKKQQLNYNKLNNYERNKFSS